MATIPAHASTSEAPFPVRAEHTPAAEGRLGLNVPAGWWPAAPRLKALEASGYTWVQVHAPPRLVLADPVAARRHARGVRNELDTTALRLVLHGPDDLSAGTPEADWVLDCLLGYAADVGAELVVYHGARFALHRADLGERVAAEERSLRERAARVEDLGLRVAIENLAPVYPSAPCVCHRPDAVAALVDRLASPAYGMCFDAGHANIVSAGLDTDVPGLLAPVLDRVVLFHLHDNYGARTAHGGVSGVDPLRLDLHLPPGRGTLPWAALAPLVEKHPAPLLLEVHPPNRPRPEQLATVASGLLRTRSRA